MFFVINIDIQSVIHNFKFIFMSATGDNFFERVYVLVRQIPCGKVTSYGAIARVLGTARSARMVGWAMNAAHNINDVPAHRVVNRKGLLTGKHHFEGANMMQQLLENEGIVIIDNQIQDFDAVFWEPIMAK
ncbi:6-O-methylguanine DNA methyltransferase [Flavobacterium psychrophilum]|nr:O6-methylguanine-DNA methyltransferase [Flavobacterium psychrophilum]GAQ48201.1 6-O-methylguanine DNA methyltransferase [Flavobacterium psychrophilum]